MRDLVFKNLTSPQKNRKILSACEIIDGQGTRSIIRRHFVCIVRQVTQAQVPEPARVHILRERNTLDHRERFTCRIKGVVNVAAYNRLFAILYMHSLNISLEALPAACV